LFNFPLAAPPLAGRPSSHRRARMPAGCPSTHRHPRRSHLQFPSFSLSLHGPAALRSSAAAPPWARPWPRRRSHPPSWCRYCSPRRRSSILRVLGLAGPRSNARAVPAPAFAPLLVLGVGVHGEVERSVRR
jgi:hypothetical protein